MQSTQHEKYNLLPSHPYILTVSLAIQHHQLRSLSTAYFLWRLRSNLDAGVGNPEDTYAVICEPQPGTDRDLHDIQPWRREQRKPVRLVNPQADRDNLEVPCYQYDAEPGDTGPSIADAFDLDVRSFAQQNTQVFNLVTVSTNFEVELTSDQVNSILSNVRAMQQFQAAGEPFFRCPDAGGGAKECRLGASVEPCTGITNCTVFYQEPDVSINPAGKVLQVCDIGSGTKTFDSVAKFDNHITAQHMALKRLMSKSYTPDAKVPHDYCNKDSWGTEALVVDCDDDGWITFLSALRLENNVALNKDLAELLLTFERLQDLSIVVMASSIMPPQLGGLSAMVTFWARSSCWDGQLPTNLEKGWPNLQFLSISHWNNQRQPQCGIQGTLPASWGTAWQNMYHFEMTDHRLSGTLPQEYGKWTRLEEMHLWSNQISGFLPASYAAWSRARLIDLSDNDIQGVIPAAWSELGDTLNELDIANNNK